MALVEDFNETLTELANEMFPEMDYLDANPIPGYEDYCNNVTSVLRGLVASLLIIRAELSKSSE